MIHSPRFAGSWRRMIPAWLLLGLWLPTWWIDASTWQASPEFRYGWLVPGLTTLLLIERWRSRPTPTRSAPAAALLAVAVAAPTWVLARLAVAPFPEWPAALWALNGAAVVLSLALVAAAGGRRWLAHFGLPFILLLTAVPWPESIRHAWIDRFGPAVASVAAAVTNEFVGPAVRRGHLVEVAGGVLGIEEACAGLRSIEALAMAALFAGEFFGLTKPRRAGLLVLAFTLAIAGNAARLVFLTWRAAADGIATATALHDTAGFVLLVFTLPLLLLGAWSWRRRSAPPDAASAGLPVPSSTASAVVAVAVVAGIVGPAWWFAEPARPARSPWTLAFPRQATGFAEAPLSPTAVSLLTCEGGRVAGWRGDDGIRRAAYFVRWTRGHNARFALALHNPQTCLPLAGAELTGPLREIDVDIDGRTLPLQGWALRDANGPFVVYSGAFHVPELTVLPPPPRTAAEWWRWRWEVLRRRGRDERVLLVAVAAWIDPTDERACAREIAAEARALLQRGDAS